MRITGGQWVNHNIAVPPGQGVRPTPDKVRQAIESTGIKTASLTGGAVSKSKVLSAFQDASNGPSFE